VRAVNIRQLKTSHSVALAAARGGGVVVVMNRDHPQALLVDLPVLEPFQEANDVLMARETLKRAYNTDVSPIIAKARLAKGGAIDPIATYRASGYRARVTAERPATGGSSSGIV